MVTTKIDRSMYDVSGKEYAANITRTYNIFNDVLDGGVFEMLTHDDLDGAGCDIVFEMFTRHFVECVHPPVILRTSLSDLSNNFDRFVNWMAISDGCPRFGIISDLSLSSLQLKKIRDMNDLWRAGTTKKMIAVIDHHIPGTALMENDPRYPWSMTHLAGSNFKIPMSATSLVYRFFREMYDTDDPDWTWHAKGNLPRIEEFVRYVDNWDTHTYGETMTSFSKMLNTVYFNMGYEWTKKYIVNKIINGPTVMDLPKQIYYMAEYKMKEIDKKASDLLSSVREFDLHVKDITSEGMTTSFKVAAVFCEDGSLYATAGEMICMQHRDDIAMFISPRTSTVSLRSIGDVDCFSLAKSLGGGGHKNAAGAVLSKENLNEIISEYLSC